MILAPDLSKEKVFLLFEQYILYSKCIVPIGSISCQFQSPGGSMGLRYVLRLLFSLKSQNC
jgi:hypothetical protein